MKYVKTVLHQYVQAKYYYMKAIILDSVTSNKWLLN